MRLFPFIGSAVVALAAGFAHADDGTITVTLGASTDPVGTYRLVGQSMFFQIRTSDQTTGGQLDGTTTPGNVINFPEAFPPPTLSDYLTFGYFGVIETVTLDLDLNETVVDQSLVVAFDAGEGAGFTFGDLFPAATYTEDELVAALVGSFDSAEFFDFADNFVLPGASTNGVTTVVEIFEPGETMDLIAFIGGTGGDEGVAVGTLNFAVTSIPEPASLALLGLGGLFLARRHGRG